MPPKKHRGVNPDQPGVARKYLQNFATFPADADGMKNGHILYVYITLGLRSRAGTERLLKQLVLTHVGCSLGSSLNADIKRVVSRT